MAPNPTTMSTSMQNIHLLGTSSLDSGSGTTKTNSASKMLNPNLNTNTNTARLETWHKTINPKQSSKDKECDKDTVCNLTVNRNIAKTTQEGHLDQSNNAINITDNNDDDDDNIADIQIEIPLKYIKK